MGIFGGVVKALEILIRRIRWCLSVHKVFFSVSRLMICVVRMIFVINCIIFVTCSGDTFFFLSWVV